MKRILVVDDDGMVRDMLKNILETRGFSVETACDGNEARKLIRANQPNCVVTDLQMPNMDGMELARWIKDLFPQIPVIMTTGRPELAEGAQVFQVLAKPVSPTKLVELIKPVTGELMT